jgi:hypothetical protein
LNDAFTEEENVLDQAPRLLQGKSKPGVDENSLPLG